MTQTKIVFRKSLNPIGQRLEDKIAPKNNYYTASNLFSRYHYKPKANYKIITASFDLTLEDVEFLGSTGVVLLQGFIYNLQTPKQLLKVGINKLELKRELFSIEIQSRSLNVSDKQARVNQLEAMCIERQKGLGELFTPEEINAFIEKPITKSERLRMYNNNGRYRNNKTPKR